MTTTQTVVLVLVLLVVAAVAAALVAQSRKRNRLKSTFGPEYDRTVEDTGRRREAERELAEREERRRSLDIRPLPEQDRRAFAERWSTTQGEFVDHPEMAVRQADLLVAEVMGRRGYPVGDFDQMSRDVSVDHAGVVHEYRQAHEISDLNDRKQASTEQLRQAMVHYRALFTELLEDGGPATGGPPTSSYDDSTSRRDDPGRDHLERDDLARGDAAGGGTVRDVGQATDEDRRSAPLDAGRADGVRTDGSGLGRGRGDTEFEHDLPRDERPRA